LSTIGQFFKDVLADQFLELFVFLCDVNDQLLEVNVRLVADRAGSGVFVQVVIQHQDFFAMNPAKVY
jgi:hypothetical protein